MEDLTSALNDHITEISLDEERYDLSNVISFDAAYRLRTHKWGGGQHSQGSHSVQKALDSYLYGENDDSSGPDDAA